MVLNYLHQIASYWIPQDAEVRIATHRLFFLLFKQTSELTPSQVQAESSAIIQSRKSFSYIEWTKQMKLSGPVGLNGFYVEESDPNFDYIYPKLTDDNPIPFEQVVSQEAVNNVEYVAEDVPTSECAVTVEIEFTGSEEPDGDGDREEEENLLEPTVITTPQSDSVEMEAYFDDIYGEKSDAVLLGNNIESPIVVYDDEEFEIESVEEDDEDDDAESNTEPIVNGSDEIKTTVVSDYLHSTSSSAIEAPIVDLAAEVPHIAPMSTTNLASKKVNFEPL